MAEVGVLLGWVAKMLTPTTSDAHYPFGRTGVDLRPIPRVLTRRSQFAFLLTVPDLALALERNSLRCLLLAGHRHPAGQSEWPRWRDIAAIDGVNLTGGMGSMAVALLRQINGRPPAQCSPTRPIGANRQGLWNGPRPVSSRCDKALSTPHSGCPKKRGADGAPRRATEEKVRAATTCDKPTRRAS
jgi:hypothetical protein